MTDDNTGGTTGPVSVAELLARNGATVGTGGRRRRGMAGGISVAELTGEIPVVRDEPPADDRTADDRTENTPNDDDRAGEERTEETPVVAEEAPAGAEEAPAEQDREAEQEPVAETATRRRPTPAFVPQEEPALFSGAPSVAGDRLRESVARPDRRSEPEQQPEPEAAVEPEHQPELDPGLEPEQAAEPETTVLTRVDADTDTHDTDRADTGADTDTATEPAAEETPDAVAPARSRGPIRQWLSLVGQGVVAIVLGALLFKGFERLWEMLPWVALVLAFFVIVGLVAVVRVLRRTDDIVSILLAVVVGVFVTLGPLAFMLST
ncbi:hypothetical protein [Rhodococcoides corynebacterioides]|uniref:hypothetical protein n=1 Tax=Rhodococcoides corynebacterioides TaxID=53972 RepID=UPI001C9AE22F|nr:hypothetical protein [Rhodococcus corynebacterioides]MBY6363844.1 hypothetical protein [Rhodococcus corynebacterioides]